MAHDTSRVAQFHEFVGGTKRDFIVTRHQVIFPSLDEFLVEWMIMWFQNPCIGKHFRQERHHDESDSVDQSFWQLIHRRNQESVTCVFFDFQHFGSHCPAHGRPSDKNRHVPEYFIFFDFLHEILGDRNDLLEIYFESFTATMTMSRIIESSNIDTIACEWFQHMLKIVHCITSEPVKINKRSDCIISRYEVLINSDYSHIL
ncbi:hypothetical protein NY2A_b356R [Paramecium bursaria Chlorella virus NY2A]|uniref:Uncharacterized protein b356R n=1 Tax=Paramecium bursaria Chlorella virus NY2A TaxID=46021 RepID=A7IWN1_PBCVN|nr:hypothetical protein NY2A_b356R [Paramecium bursaria Chlorella virus NY2A]ABT14755.1 hypothetical protein NY2A_b356R [Paramecium bursaria Chlorella virus NY2A]